MNWLGKMTLGPQVVADNRRRDLRRFSNHLLEMELVGTMDKPVASKVANPAIEAAREVRALLGPGDETVSD
jgi:hypothetical protein